MVKLLKLVGKIRVLAIAHKFISGALAVVVLTSGYFAASAIFGDEGAARYVLAEAKIGHIDVSISGSGQVASENQVDVKSKVSGDVSWVNVSAGSQVYVGGLLAQLNDHDAQKNVRDAEANLESAKIALEKLMGPIGSSVPKNKLQAEEDLKKAYDDGFNNVANTFLDLPGVMSGLETILYNKDAVFGGGNQQSIDYYASAVLPYGEDILNFRDDARAKYDEARKNYDQSFADYKAASRFASGAAVEVLIENTYATTKLIAESVKSASNLIQLYEDRLIKHDGVPPALANTYLANLNIHTGTTNKHLLSLLSVKNSIKNSKDAILNADLDIRSQQLALKQKENTLLDAKEKLADYYIRAPFTGTVAKINVKRADSVSGGTIIATIITRQKFAEISLNEVDVAKIKLGQKVNISFDAIPDLTIDGVVSEIDALGTVSQGVVTYNVKITFDTQDDRVKPGMSLTASIVTETKENVLTVPAGAVKSRGLRHYVEIVDGVPALARGAAAIASDVPPREQIVEVGLSNDVLTEIISGLEAGTRVVARTIAAPTAPAQTAPSIFGAPGGNRAGGGGGIRIAR